MPEQDIRYGLLAALILRYEQDRHQFVILPKQTVDSSSARFAIAELRNQGLVEEQVRGVIRLTALGYKKCRNAALSLADVDLQGGSARGFEYDCLFRDQIVHVR
jgi:hypothetical protein